MTMYPIAPNGIYWTIQGEKHLCGFQMAFVRLAGCDVGCALCDTDYTVSTRLGAEQIVARVQDVTPASSRDRWVWITGGEPTIHDLRPLLGALKSEGFSTALASAGHRRFIPPVDWLSVSPHDADKFAQRYGNEITLTVGLNGLDPDAFLARHPDDQTDFMYRYVMPLWAGDGPDPAALATCLDFLARHPNWSMAQQAHKAWRVP